MNAPAADRFRAAVAAAAEGTPYVVRPTEDGFDVHLDIVDATWFGLFNKAGLRKAYTHHVKVGENGRYTVVDDARTVEWIAGTPRIGANAERVVGRVKEFGAQRVWAFDDRGRFGVQADYRFDSGEGRQLVEGVARQLGLRQGRSLEERIGLGFALFTVLGLVLAGIVIGILALLDKIPS